MIRREFFRFIGALPFVGGAAIKLFGEPKRDWVRFSYRWKLDPKIEEIAKRKFEENDALTADALESEVWSGLNGGQ